MKQRISNGIEAECVEHKIVLTDGQNQITLDGNGYNNLQKFVIEQLNKGNLPVARVARASNSLIQPLSAELGKY